MSVEAYYQFEWRKTRLPGSGSYFSVVDYLYTGGERFLLSNGTYLSRTRDRTPDTGQFGAALRWNFGQIDYGLYALRFNAKDPEVYYRRGTIASSSGPPTIVDPSIVDLAIGKVGTYNQIYPEGIQIFGASASGYLGSSNIAIEVSGRRNMPLVSMTLFQLPGQIVDGNKHPLYAVGDTLHAQISTITSFGRSSFWDSANITAEIAANDRIAVTKNASVLDPTTDRAAVNFRGSFDATYFEVFPNVTLTPSLAAGFNITGNSSIASSAGAYQSRGAGDLSLSLTATYRVVWSGSLMFTHYIGNPQHQLLADRDFISLSIARTF